MIENKNWVVTSFDNNTPKSQKKLSASTQVTPESNEGGRAVTSDKVSTAKVQQNSETAKNNSQDTDNEDSVYFRSLDPESTDPVTYDDQGNVIPLSKRFDNESKDIRYQKGDEKENRPSERGRTRFQAASSSEGLNSEGRARLSRISRTQPNPSAKLQKNTQSSLNKLKKFINGDYKFNISNAESIDRLVSGLSPKNWIEEEQKHKFFLWRV